MFIKKNKSTKAITLIIFGLFFISFFSGAINLTSFGEQSEEILEFDDDFDSDQSSNNEEFENIEQIDNLNYYGEEKPESNYDRNAIEWQPHFLNIFNSSNLYNFYIC